MNMRSALIIAIGLAACAGGSDGSPTSPATTGGNNNNGNTSGNSVQNSASISIVTTQSADPYYGTSYGFGFTPSSVTVARGSTVSWVNSSGTLHNITFASAPGAPANIGDFDAGTKTVTFNTAGSYAFACTLHTGMTGIVTVQ